MQRWPFPSNRRVLYRKQDSSKDNRFQTNGENPRRKIEFVQATSTHCPICLKLVVSHSSSSYMEKRSLTKRGYRSEPTEQSLSSSLCALRFQLLHYIDSPMAATSIQKQITKSLSVQTPHLCSYWTRSIVGFSIQRQRSLWAKRHKTAIPITRYVFAYNFCPGRTGSVDEWWVGFLQYHFSVLFGGKMRKARHE